MHAYPEIPHESTPALSQAWQFSKWLHKVPDHMLTPMIVHNSRIFYVDELVQLVDGSYFIPQRWVIHKGPEPNTSESPEVCLSRENSVDAPDAMFGVGLVVTDSVV